MKSFKAFVLFLCLLMLPFSPAQAATLGPVSTYDELVALVDQAGQDDVLLVSGELIAESEPLSPKYPITIASPSGETSVIRGLRLSDAVVLLSNITLLDSLEVTGTSYVELGRGVTVLGASGASGLSFNGNGALLIDPGCQITGGEQAEGVYISHRGGEFYAGIEGTVSGGSGYNGGAGLVVSPLSGTGTLMISGKISGGDGEAIGGHALNLYDLTDNAFVTVSGTLTGGQGAIGGDGIQLVAASGNASIGISANVSGGRGRDYGGDALILMNAEGASSVNLSGTLTGGDVTQAGAQPGVSLLVVGENSSAHTRVGECILQDGRQLAQPTASPSPTPEITPAPAITPLPEITSSVDASQTLPQVTPDASETTSSEALPPLPTPSSLPSQETDVSDASDEEMSEVSSLEDAQPVLAPETLAP